MATRFYSLMRSRIEKIQAPRIISLAGGGADDYGAYKEQVGYLQALKDVLDQLEDVERETNS